MNNVWLALVTGLTTGGISCLAVQGGLLASSVSQDTEGKYGKIASFLAAKLVAYTLLGAGLGALGSTLVLTPKLLGWMQIAAGIFMLATAARLVNLHPIFRYFVIQPPKFVFRLLRKESKMDANFAPAVLGFSTILIPCGVTQAMMALAVASASPLLGAGIMAAFIIGTSPVFMALGAAVLEMLKRKWFAYAASLAILALGILSLNNGQVLRGSSHTLGNYWKVITNVAPVYGKVAGLNSEGKQEATITVTSSGYMTSATTLKVGVPVKLKLVSQNAKGCVRAFTIPSMNLSKVLPENGKETLEFTPQAAGRLAFTCSMGMYTGEFTVVN